jgi:hypothetical protein
MLQHNKTVVHILPSLQSLNSFFNPKFLPCPGLNVGHKLSKPIVALTLANPKWFAFWRVPLSNGGRKWSIIVTLRNASSGEDLFEPFCHKMRSRCWNVCYWDWWMTEMALVAEEGNRVSVRATQYSRFHSKKFMLITHSKFFKFWSWTRHWIHRCCCSDPWNPKP